MTPINNLGTFLVMILLMFAKPFAYGFALMKLWNWFVIPFQTEGMYMTYPIAVGIMIISILFIMKTPSKDDRSLSEVLDDTWNKLKYTIIIPAIVLGMGWLIKLIFM